jgi:hypothetical protein
METGTTLHRHMFYIVRRGFVPIANDVAGVFHLWKIEV